MTSCSSCFTHSQTITLLIVSLFLTLCCTSLHLLCQALLTINPGKSSHRPLSKQNTHLSCTSMNGTEAIGYNHKNQLATSWERTCSFGTEAEMMRLFLSFKMTKHGKWDINGLARALLHISCDYAGFRQNVFRALNVQMTQRDRKMWARIFYDKVSRSKYPLICFNQSPWMFPTGICPWYEYKLHRPNHLIPFHEQIARPKNGLYFTPLPKTITPPNVAPPRMLQSNRSSAFEVFMDINDPTFQKSSTCLA